MNKKVVSVSNSKKKSLFCFLLIYRLCTRTESIYGNVLNISQNTKQAAEELTTANRHQKKARKNMCCLLLIITIVGCVLALIIVVAK
jgi:t-SNARE complex subunit (syntaxin)